MAGDLTGPLRSLVRALFRMNRPTTDGIGRMPSVLYFLRSESEQLPLRCESGSGRPCRSVPGPVIGKTNRFESDATFRDLHTISIATQQRSNETIVRAARIYFIKIYSSIFIKNIINSTFYVEKEHILEYNKNQLKTVNILKCTRPLLFLNLHRL